MNIRTDLALEALESAVKASGEQTGVDKSEYDIEGFKVTKIEITNHEGEEALGKPIGKYVTIDLGALMRREEDAFPRACKAVASVISELAGTDKKALTLIAGLGNRLITPDAVGPIASENIVATRHLIESTPEYFGDYRPVATISPGVLGLTGVETGEIIKGVMDKISPQVVIAVDALAARRLSRLLKTIQLSDTGIVPGSGVGNARFALTKENLGVPVIAIGVPTVVDGQTLASDIEEQTGIVQCEALDDLKEPVVVTTKDIDREVGDVARVIGYGINLALHPQISIEDIDLFLS